MAVQQIADRHARLQTALARRTAADLARLWSQVDLTRVAASWTSMLPQAMLTLSTGQATAALESSGYVDAVARAYGMAANGVRVLPTGFAGIASDGRGLAALIYQPAITTLEQIKAGRPPTRAATSGGFLLDMIARTQVADAGRTADGAAIVAHRELTGYVRMVVGGSCGRCIVLAGRRYRVLAGFKRHPR